MQFPDSKSVSLHFSIFGVLFNPYQAVVRFWSAPCHNGLAISCISCKCNPTLSGGIPRSCGIALWFLTLVQAARAQSYKMQQAFEPSAEGVGHMRSDKSSCLVQINVHLFPPAVQSSSESVFKHQWIRSQTSQECLRRPQARGEQQS